MKKTLTLNTFRRMTVLEEQMLRATMPKTSALDVTPLEPHFAVGRSHVIASLGGTRLARRSMADLTYTLAEVAHV